MHLTLHPHILLLRSKKGHSMILDLMTLLFYGLLFFHGKEKEPLKQNEKPWLSKACGQCMKGWFSIAIILHHLSQRTGDGYVFRHFLFAGVFCVSCFLFYSGCGLMKSCLSKPDYEKHYLRRRILPVLVPFVIYNIILWFAYRYEGTVYSFADFIYGLSRGEPMAIFSWYVYFILLFYGVFYGLMKICRKDAKKMIRGAIVFNVIWIVFCFLRGFGVWWYNTAHIIIFGMYYGAFEDQCDAWISTRRRRLVPICTAAVLICSWLPYVIPWFIQLPVFIFSTVCFTLLMIALLMKRIPYNRALMFLGSVSYELYLVHELFILLLRGKHIYIASDTLWIAAVLICSLIAAYLFKCMLAPLKVRICRQNG